MPLSIGEFANMLERRLGAIPEAKTAGLAEAGELIAADARARIGHYQGAEFGFPAWAPLADATRTERVRQGYSPDDPLLRSGALRNAIEVRLGEESVRVGVFDPEMLPIARGNEIGFVDARTSVVHPPRPFIGTAGRATLPAASIAIFRRIVAVMRGL